MTRALALGLALGIAGCADAPGVLDPEVVSELARRPGDAEGTLFSGFYVGTLDVVDCGCPTGVLGSICPAMGATGTLGALFDVTHGDGLLEISSLGDSLFGHVDADGSFAVGEVLELDAGVLGGILVSRIDGDFDLHEGGGSTVSGTVARHIEGDEPETDPETGEIVGTRAIDCYERFELEAERTGV